MPQEAQNIAGLLYDGVIQPEAWYAALDALRVRLQAGVFHAFTLDTSGAPVPESVGNPEAFGLQEKHMAEYEMQHAAHDVRLPALFRLAPCEVMLDHEHVSAREISGNSVYTDWLAPIGLKYSAAAVTRLQGSARDVVSFLRPRDASAFSQEDKDLFLRLIPDIARAGRLRLQMRALARNATLGMAALDGLKQGILIVDAALRIHHANRSAEQLLTQPGGLSVRHGQLMCWQAEIQQRMVYWVSRACALPAVAGSITAEQDVQRMVINILPLRPDHALASAHEVPMALIVVTLPGKVSGMEPQWVGAMLGLSLAEARLAILLTSGKTVKDFANLEGTSWHTAREHLKNLMRKTHCHRQSALVQLLQSLQSG